MKKHILLTCVLLVAVFLVGCGAKKQPAGTYSCEVTLTGGTGRASIESPTTVTVDADGNYTAQIIWSSSNYDYMIVGETKYYDQSSELGVEGHSVFLIPVTMDEDITVIADTTAMSVPHEIEYVLHFSKDSLKEETVSLEAKPSSKLELTYANQFAVDFYKGGYSMITTQVGQRYLVVPNGVGIPANLDSDVIVIPQSAKHVYMASSSTMDFYRALSALSDIKMTSTQAEDWAIPEIAEKVQDKSISFVGKYSAPDYEYLVANSCNLAIENTMISHAPDIKEKLEELGIPVFIDYSSYEESPYGRLEWIKAYGVLSGHLSEAQSFFEQELARLENLPVKDEGDLAGEAEGPKVAVFFISASGNAVVRRPGDYLSEMLSIAGARYAIPISVLSEYEGNSATINMEMETFYKYASDADIIIYNSAISGDVETVEALLAKNVLFADFKAVKDGHVFCTNCNLFQQTTGICEMIEDFSRMVANPDITDESLNFLHTVK